jgi:RDD family
MRFDEVELLTFDDTAPPSPSEPTRSPFFRRAAALLIDVSLFAALALALSPLLPAAMSWMAIAGLAGFVVLVSYYYFVGSWMLWGKTIGGAIFDVRVSGAMSLRSASVRWAVLCAVMVGVGLGVFAYVRA